MIDSPVLNIIEFFNSTLASFTSVAWKLSVVIALVGIIWASFQVTIGTSDVRKAYVGAIVKLFTFLLCMSLYPGFSTGLRVFTSSLGWEKGGDNGVSTITSTLAAESAALGNLAQKMEANKAALAVKKGKVTERDIKKQNKAALNNGNFVGDTTGLLKRRQAIANVLKQDGGTGNMFLDLKLRDASGKDTGYYSPDALFNVTLMIGQIAIETEKALDVEANADSKGVGAEYLATGNDEAREMLRDRVMAGVSNVRLLDLPALALGRLVVCCIAVAIMLCCQIACLIQYVMAIVEYSISQAVCVILVPMTLMDELKEYSHKILGTLFAQGMKLCMITITMVMDLEIFSKLLNQITNDGSAFGIIQFGQFVLTGLLSFALCSNGPKLAATICTGSPQMSMGEFMQSVGAAAAAGAVVNSQAKQGGRFVGNRVSDGKKVTAASTGAYKQARSNGATRMQALGHAMKTGGKEAGHLMAYNTKQSIKQAMSQPGASLLKGNAFQRGSDYNPGHAKAGAWKPKSQENGGQSSASSALPGASANALPGGRNQTSGLPSPSGNSPSPSSPNAGSEMRTSHPPDMPHQSQSLYSSPSLSTGAYGTGPAANRMAGQTGPHPSFTANLERQQNANLYSETD